MNRHIYCKSTTKMCYFILDPIVINESIGKCVFLTMWCLGGRMRDSIFGVEKKTNLVENAYPYLLQNINLKEN